MRDTRFLLVKLERGLLIMVNIEQIRKILEEQKTYQKRDVKFVPELFESKLQIDTIYFTEAIGYFTQNEPNKELVDEAFESLMNEAARLHETLNFKPYILEQEKLYEDSDILTYNTLTKKMTQVIESALLDIQKKFESITENYMEQIKSKITTLLERGYTIDEISDFLSKYIVLSELIDDIILTPVNKKYMQNLDVYMNEHDLDKEHVTKVIDSYNAAKDKFIETILGL